MMVYYFYATYADPDLLAESHTSCERITVDLDRYPYCDPCQDNLLQAWLVAVNVAYKLQKRPGKEKRTLICIIPIGLPITDTLWMLMLCKAREQQQKLGADMILGIQLIEPDFIDNWEEVL